MSAEKLAFLQNFYTDVTLYVPTEATTPAAAAEPPAAPLPPAPAPREARPAVPVPPVREIATPPTGFSRPSAGLERLAASYSHPIAPAEQSAAPTESAAAPTERSAEGVLPRQDALAGPSVAPAVPPVMLTPFTTMGDKAEGVILLFRLPQEQFLKMHRNVFLNKMLQALNLVMADVMLVNVESELPVALANLRQQLAATHIVAFGKNLLDATIRNTQIYEPVLFPNLNLSYLSSATVELVEYDVSLKKRLWPGLKAMFLG